MRLPRTVRAPAPVLKRRFGGRRYAEGAALADQEVAAPRRQIDTACPDPAAPESNATSSLHCQ
jgi:hypothetical protein